jgi:RND family efflux transporter MFP subunit
MSIVENRFQAMKTSTRRYRPPIAVAVLLSGAILFLLSCNKQEPPKQVKKQAGPVSVKLQPVQVREIARVVDSVGTFYPFDETVISAEVDGKVLNVSVDLGDYVTKGSPLVRLSDEEQQYLLAQDEAQLRSSLERLGLKSEKDRVQDVNQTAEVRTAMADLTEAEQRYKRIKSLVDQGLTPVSELDTVQARLKSTQAAYDQAVKGIRNLIQETERFKASVDLTRKKLRDTNVFAPFDALVKEKSVNVGQFVRANTTLVTLVRTDPLRLRIEIPERLGPWIKQGQVAEIESEAFEGRKFSGKISRISPTVDQAKRTFIVEALIPNPRNELKPGSYARARVPTNRRDAVKLIPSRAINYVFGSNKAYVVKDDQIEARDVKLGDRFEQQVEILEGLSEGEVVATSRLNQLDTGVKVRAE